MSRSQARLGIISFAVGAAIAGGVGVAWADYTYSSVSGPFGPFYGDHRYYNQSFTQDYTDCPYANICSQADVWTENGGIVPAGYMGADSLLYGPSGLCRDSGILYNTSSTSEFANYADPGCGSGNYFSYGKTYLWINGGYAERDTAFTPELSFTAP